MLNDLDVYDDDTMIQPPIYRVQFTSHQSTIFTLYDLATLEVQYLPSPKGKVNIVLPAIIV